MNFVSRATPIDDIDGKSYHGYVAEKQPPLFNQSFKVKITLLVIYGLGGVHTRRFTHAHAHTQIHTHTHTHTQKHAYTLTYFGGMKV